ncbi:MAG: 6-phosphogluconolactonase [Bacteroidota bacterium]
MRMRREVFPTAAALTRGTAEEIVRIAIEAQRRSGRVALALSGGSTPRGVFELLGSRAFSAKVNWSHVHLFWADERCVPPDLPESNFRMVQETLLTKIDIPERNIHRMKGELPIEKAAVQYEKELKAHFPVEKGEWPRFDLIMLGLGEDGHTASLFPGTDGINESGLWVTSVFVERLQSHRLTLTFPVINSARSVMFLVSGSAKARILKEVVEGERMMYPAQRVRPANGTLIWMCDYEATRLLTT